MKHLMRTCLLAALMAGGGSALAATEVLVTYYHNDAASSPVAATDEMGNELWREHYLPYGERKDNEPASKGNTRWYAGKTVDASGLSYFGARYYDPVVGRFLARDPVEFEAERIASFNRYAYADNNPYRYIDPNGEVPIFLGIPLIIKAVDYAITAYDLHQAYQEGGSEAFIQEAATNIILSNIPGAKIGSKAIDGFRGIVSKGDSAGGIPKGEVPEFIFRGGGKNPGSLTPRPKDEGFLSARDSLSNPIPGRRGKAPLQSGEPIQVIDTSKLPPGSVRVDGGIGGRAPGHVSIGPNVLPQAIKDAIVETIPRSATR